MAFPDTYCTILQQLPFINSIFYIQGFSISRYIFDLTQLLLPKELYLITYIYTHILMRLSIRSSSCKHSKRNTADELFQIQKGSSKKFSLPVSTQSNKSNMVRMPQNHLYRTNQIKNTLIQDKFTMVTNEMNTNKLVQRNFISNQVKNDWKILSLRQLKNIKEDDIVNSRKNPEKRRQKLFVSLSKRNQGMFVGGEPKLANIGCESGVLKDILKRRRIVDLIEQQLQQKSHHNRLLCI